MHQDYPSMHHTTTNGDFPLLAAEWLRWLITLWFVFSAECYNNNIPRNILVGGSHRNNTLKKHDKPTIHNYSMAPIPDFRGKKHIVQILPSKRCVSASGPKDADRGIRRKSFFTMREETHVRFPHRWHRSFTDKLKRSKEAAQSPNRLLTHWRGNENLFLFLITSCGLSEHRQ